MSEPWRVGLGRKARGFGQLLLRDRTVRRLDEERPVGRRDHELVGLREQPRPDRLQPRVDGRGDELVAAIVAEECVRAPSGLEHRSLLAERQREVLLGQDGSGDDEVVHLARGRPPPQHRLSVRGATGGEELPALHLRRVLHIGSGQVRLDRRAIGGPRQIAIELCHDSSGPGGGDSPGIPQYAEWRP